MRRFVSVAVALGGALWAAGIARAGDFEPAKGAGAGPGREGPWVHRLLGATSRDGLTFERQGAVIADQASAPQMVLDRKGRLYLYFTGWTVGSRRNETAVAISDDRGKNWSFKYLVLEGFERMPPAGDPDVVILEDGTFRMFLTSARPGSRSPSIFCTEGKDGIHFKNLGAAFEIPGAEVIDSVTFRVGDRWELFALRGAATGMWHATSRDGRAFSRAEEMPLEIDGEAYILSDALEVGDGLRVYAFSPPRREIRSFSIKRDGTWAADPGPDRGAVRRWRASHGLRHADSGRVKWGQGIAGA